MSEQTDLRDRFWDRLDDVNAGMLGLRSDLRFVPMSHYADRDSAALWFITARQTDLARHLADGPQPALHLVTDGREGLFARIEGQISLSEDRAKLDELWNAVASSWFEEGRRDDDIQLLRFDAGEAEVWLTGGSLGFLYQIARSKLTGDKPDLGEHGMIAI
ncbi:pyridoxamine 5'-phosphate oxidase family protein [Paracoccus spongiarum]|uniref:Pyridoxamine 5'-phosphate oxidase family protein n=1 Tax=Paracoccus spongiarum TaxID=3064387 RepID=A0ABT9J937_9RHOB|nr:pyridoxamine 5'-phosphate oxidase family protein [Paracoccus sp. 2205BS29-5]MDP5306343.1 pyridoxamine 5'-phosphate oxidase family protein [Paracoccus sp. 2205BS29-5]